MGSPAEARRRRGGEKSGGSATVWPLRGRLRLRRVLGQGGASRRPYAQLMMLCVRALSMTDQGLRTVPKAPDGGASRPDKGRISWTAPAAQPQRTTCIDALLALECGDEIANRDARLS